MVLAGYAVLGPATATDGGGDDDDPFYRTRKCDDSRVDTFATSSTFVARSHGLPDVD